MQLLSGIFPVTEASLMHISWCWQCTWAPAPGFHPSRVIIQVLNLPPRTCSHKYREMWYSGVLCCAVTPCWGWASRRGCQAGGGTNHWQPTQQAKNLPQGDGAAVGWAELLAPCASFLSGPGSAGENTPRAAAGFSLRLKCHPRKGNKKQEISSLYSYHKPVILCPSTMSSSTQNQQQENTSMSLLLLLCQARLLRGICHLISWILHTRRGLYDWSKL